MASNVAVEKLQEYTGHKGSIFAMSLDRAGHLLYTSGDDGVVARWALDRDEDEGSGVLRIAQSVYSLDYLPAEGLLAAGSSDGTLQLLDLDSREIVYTYRKFPKAIYGFHYDQVRRRLWILYGNGFLAVLQLPDFSEVFHYRLSRENLRSICPHPEEDLLFVGSSDNRIFLLDGKDGKPYEQWEAHDNSVFSLAIHHEGNYLLSGGRDAHLNVWELKPPFRSIQRIPAHLFTVNDIRFAPGGDHFLTASRDKTIKLWDAYDFSLLKVIDFARNEAHRHSVNKVRWLPWAPGTFVSCGDDRRVIRWGVTWAKS